MPNMHTSERRQTTLSRRKLLTGIAGVAGGIACTTPATAATPSASASPTVLTQNAYIGVDLSRLLDVESLAEVRQVAGEFLAGVDPTLYEARADGIAGHIENTGADVVALQEVANLRTQRPSDFGSASPEQASDTLVDFLSLVESALADRDLAYDVAATTVTTDLELPAQTDEGPVDVRITDRDVLLVRSEHEIGETVTDTYEAALPAPLPGIDNVSVERGFCTVDVTMEGVPFTVVSTHLESVTGLIRRQQAQELLDSLPSGRPVILCGDFNSGPESDSDTYDLLTGSFEDPYTTLQSDGDGFTCCQAADLGNEQSGLDRRIDLVLYRGDVRPTEIGRVGHRPEDRITVETGGETVEVWPSDHAGVVGTFEVSASTPTATAVQTATPTPGSGSTESPTQSRSESQADTPASTPGGGGPGLGPFAALVGVGAGVAARVWRD